jgi:hypothetical protein
VEQGAVNAAIDPTKRFELLASFCQIFCEYRPNSTAEGTDASGALRLTISIISRMRTGAASNAACPLAQGIGTLVRCHCGAAIW